MSSLPEMWLYIAVTVAFFNTLTQINLILWRSQQRAKPYALYQLSQSVLNISISLWLIILLDAGWEGRTSGTASAFVIFGLLSAVLIFVRGFAKLSFDKAHIFDALKFGIPLIPHHLALWLRSGVDIFLITAFIGISQTGLYAVGYQFGAIIGILAAAFNNAYSPHLYETLKNATENDKIRIVKFTYLAFGTIILLALALSLFSYWFIPIFLGPSFHGAYAFVFWIALGYAFNGMYLIIVNYIYYIKKTYLLSTVTVSMGLFHALLSLTLIQFFGAMGAAYATTISFFTTFVLVWRLSSKVFAMPWRYWRRTGVENA